METWTESHQIIITQLKTLEDAFNVLSRKVEGLSEGNRDRVETQDALGDLRVRIAMLEISAKIWGGVIGMLTAAATTLIVDLVIGHFTR